MRVGSKGPAKLPPMEITLDRSKWPMRLTGQRYPAQQINFQDSYFFTSVLVKLCLVLLVSVMASCRS